MVQRFPITLTQLVYFAECARTLNMTAASQELHIAQSAVSTAITQLERSLGATLFVRQHSKGLVLTAAGENLLRDTRKIFAQLTESIDSIHQDQTQVQGAIRIACFVTLGPVLLPRLIQRLEQQHPRLTVEIVEGDDAENLAALRSGQVELAVNYNLTASEDIRREIVGEARPYAIVATDHPLAARREVRLEELAEESFIMLDLPSSSDYFLSVLRHAGVTPRVRHQSSSFETVRSMVAAGLGYSILNQRPRTDETYIGDRVAALEIADAVARLLAWPAAAARQHLDARQQLGPSEPPAGVAQCKGIAAFGGVLAQQPVHRVVPPGAAQVMCARAVRIVKREDLAHDRGSAVPDDQWPNLPASGARLSANDFDSSFDSSVFR